MPQGDVTPKETVAVHERSSVDLARAFRGELERVNLQRHRPTVILPWDQLSPVVQELYAEAMARFIGAQSGGVE